MSPPDQRTFQSTPHGGAPTPARLLAGGFARGQGRRAVFALFATVMLHAGVVLVAPDELTRRIAPFEPRQAHQLEVILEEPEPEEFVLTNPDAVSNPPDETRFFSDRNQQAAQEEEAEAGDPSLPSVEGDEPEPNQNIVSSQSLLSVPKEEAVSRGEGEEIGELAFEPLPERLIPGFDPAEEAEGLDVPVAPEAEAEPEENPVFGVELGAGKEARKIQEQVALDGGEREQVKPRPRPVLSQLSRGPVGARAGAATRVGQVAVDANFSEYGDYLARMIDVIVRQWHILAWDSLQAGEVGTVVTVSFRVDAKGEIHGLEVVQSTASLVATLICQDAIASRQPYGEWTSDMRQVLGEEQTIQIRFLYR